MHSAHRPFPPTAPAQSTRLFLLGGLLLAFGLRLYRLGAESFWYDETVSVFLARQETAALIAHTARDIHPPGYYLLLHAWGRLTQPTLYTGLEFLFTWPSLVWGILLLPLVYSLGRRLFSPRIGLMGLLLAAVNPYHIWYSQEARMYTVGAALGLLCLWAALDALGLGRARQAQESCGQRKIRVALLLYALSGAAGLYTLYYFAFLLIGLNLVVLAVWIGQSRSGSGKASVAGRATPGQWLLANLLIVLLWLPWLPTVWRQVTEPPVPPWRGGLELPVVAAESLAALLVGQAPPGGILWLWAGVVALLLLAAIFVSGVRGDVENRGMHARLLLAVVFAPLLLIVLLSLAVTPLYHIRYFFTYAPVGLLLVAVGLENGLGRWRWLHAMALAALLGISGLGLRAFWTDPAYRADDHRGAVAALAAAWRPGDAVLVNAGWAYTALAVYWPPAPMPSGETPVQFPDFRRLIDYAKNEAPDTPSVAGRPVILVGGSVDGDGTLGWGLAESDFYPISREETGAALTALSRHHPRIWHYRIYDTVSDPDGVIRAWLETQTDPILDQPYPGRDYLRVQAFATAAPTDDAACEQAAQPQARFGNEVALLDSRLSPSSQSGSMLYATLCVTGTESERSPHLRASLRLYPPHSPDGAPLAQKDTPLEFDFTTRNVVVIPLGLPVPADLPPGDYRLELIIYDGRSGEPLAIDDPRAVYGQRWPLDEALSVGSP